MSYFSISTTLIISATGWAKALATHRFIIQSIFWIAILSPFPSVDIVSLPERHQLPLTAQLAVLALLVDLRSR